MTVTHVSSPIECSSAESSVQLRKCWCSSELWRIQFQSDSYKLLSCAVCGCYRIDPPPVTHDDESSDFYTNYYTQTAPVITGEIETGKRTLRFWKVVDCVPALQKIEQRVIDIGCGDGYLCAELQNEGWPSVVGMDVSKSRISRARQLHPGIEFRDRLPYESDGEGKPADLVIMDNVLEHLPDPLAMVQQLRRLLGPAGKIVLITPNMESGHFRLLGRYWTPELAPSAHIFLFTGACLRELLVRAELTVEATGSFHMPFYSARSLVGRFCSGDVRGAVWRTAQEMGGLYGRVVGSGPMLYAVASLR